MFSNGGGREIYIVPCRRWSQHPPCCRASAYSPPPCRSPCCSGWSCTVHSIQVTVHTRGNSIHLYLLYTGSSENTALLMKIKVFMINRNRKEILLPHQKNIARSSKERYINVVVRELQQKNHFLRKSSYWLSKKSKLLLFSFSHLIWRRHFAYLSRICWMSVVCFIVQTLNIYFLNK
jgi:hypothetical protein